MRMNDPPLFAITMRMREYYDKLLSVTMDAPDALALSTKVLKYILRCQMSDNYLYHKPTANIKITSTIERARKNFGRLLKQCDVCNVLPVPALGIIRYTYPLAPFPIQPAQRSYIMQTGQQQCSLIENFIQRYANNLVIYMSNYGITPVIALPTITIVLDDILSASSSHIINELRTLYAFDQTSFLVRFVQGRVIPCGRIWYYGRVPIGGTISPNEYYINPPTAGTLGCYCVSDHSDEVFALTAGHVARPVHTEETIKLYAPAQKPFDEAMKSTQVARSYCIDKDMDSSQETDMLVRLSSLDRSFGEVVYCSSRTDAIPPYRKIDFALIRVENNRRADNNLSKLPLFRQEYKFTPAGMELRNAMDPVHIGDPLVKLGTRTGLTTGTAIDEVKVRWDPLTTRPLMEDENDDIRKIPISNAYAILGNVKEDGIIEDFAQPGDSGALVARIHQDLKEAPVTKSEAVGILYGIVYEEPRDHFVALYIPMQDIYEKVRDDLGLRISVEGVGNEGDGGPWQYTELGQGRSMHDLK